MSTPAPPEPGEPSPAFDREARHYRLNWDSRPIVQNWRGRVLAAVLADAPVGSSVVDVGAGSGADAAALEAAGCRVTAIEPSAGMRRVALERGVVACAGSFVDAPALAGPGHDRVLLNFGVLNCLLSLESLGPTLQALLRVGGRAVLVWMSRHCPVDTLSRLARGQRPRRGRAAAVVAGESIPVRWWRVSEVEEALGPAFRVRHVEAIGLLVPSPDLGGAPGRRSAVEPALASLPVLRGWGDHTLCIVERVS